MSLRTWTEEELPQGSDDWLAARCGVITASTIGKLITVGIVGASGYGCPDCGAEVDQPCMSKASKTPKPITTFHGARSAIAAEVGAMSLTIARTDTADALLLNLAAERITGHVEEMFVSAAMARGTEDEPFARDEYAEWAKVKVDEIGFAVRTESGIRLGYSPDGLVGDQSAPSKDGLIECKSRGQARQLSTVLHDEVPAENLAQMHAGMWVMDRAWCDYISYRDGLHLYVKRVHRDPLWDKAIQEAAAHAERIIRGYVAAYTVLVTDAGLPFIEKRPDLIDTITF